MSNIVKLPSNNTATWKDADSYTLKDRKFVLRGLKQEDLNDLTNILDVLERIAVVSITEWSFELIPPNIRPESLDQLSLTDIDALMRESRVRLPKLMPDLIEPEDGEVADPKADTPNLDA